MLIADDDDVVRDVVRRYLERDGLDVSTAHDGNEALRLLCSQRIDVAILDVMMPGPDGLSLCGRLREGGAYSVPVILLTGEGDIPMAVRALGAGAFAFLEKPCATEDLLKVLDRALKARAMVLENRRFKSQIEAGDPAARMIFGTSALAEALRAQVRQVAASTADALPSGPKASAAAEPSSCTDSKKEKSLPRVP